MVGLETALGLGLKLVSDGLLSLSELIGRMSVNPARILNIPGGPLRTGSAADVTVIDPERRWSVDRERFHSKGRNTPFHGWDIRGKAVMTIVGGEVKFQES
jgi:dihydroorotase